MDDDLGSVATTKRMYHNLKQNARVAYAKDSWRILSERNRHGLDRGHVGALRARHGETMIAIRHGGSKPRQSWQLVGQLLAPIRVTHVPLPERDQ